MLRLAVRPAPAPALTVFRQALDFADRSARRFGRSPQSEAEGLMPNSQNIFMSYVRDGDETRANEVYDFLVAEGFCPWMDRRNIRGGDWQLAIKRAMRTASRIVILLSRKAVFKRGYFQLEIKEALSLSAEKLPDDIFIVPVRLEECLIPESLDRFQYFDLFEPSGRTHFTRALKDVEVREANQVPAIESDITSNIAFDPQTSIPSLLTPVAFAYSKPEWLDAQRENKLADLAKAAFVLLMFEQTERGSWGKTYLLRYLPPSETLPAVLGAITGTVFALIAISSLLEREEIESTDLSGTNPWWVDEIHQRFFGTLHKLLQPHGRYRRRDREGSVAGTIEPEHPRHEAGACLMRLMYDWTLVDGVKPIDGRDLKTIEWLCGQSLKAAYDLAVVSRLLLQIRFVDGILPELKRKVDDKLGDVLAALVSQIESASGSNLVSESGRMAPSTEQWSTVWYLLPMLTLSSDLEWRATLVNRLRQFLRARASTTHATDLLPASVNRSEDGPGQSVFGTGVGLLSWRTLERTTPNDENRSNSAQNMIDRLIASPADTIRAPMFNPPLPKVEGYLGWGAICLGAASVGIRISYDDCSAAIILAKNLNAVPAANRSERDLKTDYAAIINKSRLLQPNLVDPVARAAARLSFIYEPVERKKDADRGIDI
jgi:hypothetical protein